MTAKMPHVHLVARTGCKQNERDVHANQIATQVLPQPQVDGGLFVSDVRPSATQARSASAVVSKPTVSILLSLSLVLLIRCHMSKPRGVFVVLKSFMAWLLSGQTARRTAVAAAWSVGVMAVQVGHAEVAVTTESEIATEQLVTSCADLLVAETCKVAGESAQSGHVSSSKAFYRLSSVPRYLGPGYIAPGKVFSAGLFYPSTAGPPPVVSTYYRGMAKIVRGEGRLAHQSGVKQQDIYSASAVLADLAASGASAFVSVQSSFYQQNFQSQSRVLPVTGFIFTFECAGRASCLANKGGLA